MLRLIRPLRPLRPLSHPIGIRAYSSAPFDISTKILKDDDIAKHDDKKFITHPLFPHPTFTDAECRAVEVEHREPRTLSDKFAYNVIQIVRKSFDYVTGYKKSHDITQTFKGTRYEMTENKWMTRVIFLESIAGVPGMAAAFIRHLNSLRVLKRDKAWIETLLDEAYNERMHLLTFIKIGKPSLFTRVLIFMSQGIFTNIFFFAYLFRPSLCHRVVGYLEEEAVATYTHLIYQLQNNQLPKFNNLEIPTIAKQYWAELDDKSTFTDLILRIRADEAKHREVNHTFANLKTKTDRNPFALELKEHDDPQPNNGLDQHRGTGWERKDLHL